jgi:hypothetical protein
MALQVTSAVDAVARLAGDVVAVDPVAYTVFGTIAHAVRLPDAAPWAAHPAGSSTILAARSSRGTGVAFTAGWTTFDEVAAAVADMEPPTVGLGGPPETVEAVAAALGRPVTERMSERLFRLDELVAPAAVAGSARLARSDDAEWLADWYTAFMLEAFGRLAPGFDPVQLVRRGVERSRCWIWIGADERACAMAVSHPAVDGVSRIGPVYTPHEHRGRGYGSAVTAAASRDILDAGNVACLYTDLANPTSNKIYQALGYRAVLDRATVRFD